jgi:hypothetical protein
MRVEASTSLELPARFNSLTEFANVNVPFLTLELLSSPTNVGDPTTIKELRLFFSNPARFSGGNRDMCVACEEGEVDLSPSLVESSSSTDRSALLVPPLRSASRDVRIASRIIVPGLSVCSYEA